MLRKYSCITTGICTLISGYQIQKTQTTITIARWHY